MPLKKNVSQSGNKPGFSLIEIIIALALVGLLMAITVPNLLGRRVVQERKAFASELNTVMSEVWLRGLENNILHKITFDLEHRKIEVSQQTDTLDAEKKPIFAPVALHFASNSYTWPETFEIQQLYVQGVDEIAAGGLSRKTENIWFFMMPDGTTQEVIINIVDQPENQSEKDAKQISIVLNPFTAQCVMYDTFQKPLS